MSGIDSKPDVILIEQAELLIFIKILQSQYGSNGEYLKYFKTNVMTIRLSGGENHLYNEKLCQKFMNIGDVTPSKDEKEIYSAIHGNLLFQKNR